MNLLRIALDLFQRFTHNQMYSDYKPHIYTYINILQGSLAKYHVQFNFVYASSEHSGETFKNLSGICTLLGTPRLQTFHR